MPVSIPEKSPHWQDWVTLLAGAFFLASTLIFDISNTAVSLNCYLVGGALMAAALAALFMPAIWEEVIILLLGLWLLASPWILDFSDLHNVTSLTVGVAVVTLICASWVIQEEHRFVS
ncbi:hypothetical protein HFRIS_005163 [Herbaspirillum frisingense GSF30]|uniref:SPW repeat-containing integral membrane domain-containing protein n=1 Tax=Herbaspirillum frisingense GSF30 TaxID=864073 RepID=A0AAI9IGT3_9BURK|nr:SPW repeat protein [Herbaspirillum frisingense]EOA05821.1 hypothetical protein HFRIS_005163 [Herbaspirillum frisingense GSF30]